jgi:UDP-hydrolysing UDP-N-acetyl-D-glucosamine 2-epimerase
VAVATGSRAEYGLLRPVMRAIAAHPACELRVVVSGSHLLGARPTVAEVERDFEIAGRVEMQRAGERGRLADAEALGRGVAGFAAWLRDHTVDFVVVLGDRIEALAAAAAAAVGGVRVAHLHGGDRAEGIADEGMRHAITKLAHLHLPATEGSARRIEAMGEEPSRIHIVGSPAIDELGSFPPLAESTWQDMGRPEIVVLHHPLGRGPQRERSVAEGILAASRTAGRVIVLGPNHDPGRDAIVEAVEASGLPFREHVPRGEFVGLLRRASALVGNSSAGLVEAAALGLSSVNVGPRQGGRERPDNVADVDEDDNPGLVSAVSAAIARGHRPVAHPFGDGSTGTRVAAILADLDPAHCLLVKRNRY